MDGCLIDALDGSALRPGADALLSGLKAKGDVLLLWSAGGEDYARRRATAHRIGGFFDGFFAKQTRDERGYYRTDHLPSGDGPITFVDDQPGDLDPNCTVIGVRPYLGANSPDNGLDVFLQPGG